VSHNQTPTARQKIKEIKQEGFRLGVTPGGACESCGKNCARLWWRQVSWEHSQWAGHCRDCAYLHIHPWDRLMRMRRKQEGST
jgi:hypothetical protein